MAAGGNSRTKREDVHGQCMTAQPENMYNVQMKAGTGPITFFVKDIAMVSSNFKAPFGPHPFMRASIIPRWAIIRMSRTQSVAEHSFNVAMITRAILSNFIMETMDDNEIIVAALDHDWKEEIYTGDIPSPAKVDHEQPVGTGNKVIKLADMIEAYVFAEAHCVDSAAVTIWLLGGLKKSIGDLSVELGISVPDLWSFIYNLGAK